MAMGVIWTALAAAALVCGAVNGRLDAVTAAALEGAGAAVELVLTMAGAMCLWCGRGWAAPRRWTSCRRCGCRRCCR